MTYLPDATASVNRQGQIHGRGTWQTACGKRQGDIEPLPLSELEQKGDEELVLRFFALKNAEEDFQGSVRDWLDNYMEVILLGSASFHYEAESVAFKEVFDYLAEVLGAGSFVRYRGDQPVGGLAPAYFEAVTVGVLRMLPDIRRVHADTVRGAIVAAVQSDDFRSNTGPAANTKAKLHRRVEIITESLMALARTEKQQ